MNKNNPGTLQWLISCDESGIGGANYYGFGSLWMKWQRRGDFAQHIREIREKHNYWYELKWNKAHNKKFNEFFLDIVRYFFKRQWIAFHCLIVRKGMVRKDLHGGSFDLARRKHFTMLIANKIDKCMKAHPKREHTFRVWVDPIASSYEKADEAVEVIANNILAQAFGKIRLVDKVITKDSKDTETIQICDLLLGAVMDAWQQKANSRAKLAIQQCISEHLGWADLRADTKPNERKFNIWYFYDETLGTREVVTREIKLKHPLPPKRVF